MQGLVKGLANAASWEVRNETDVTLRVEVDRRGEKSIAPGGSATWNKAYGDQVTVHARNEKGENVASKKFDALGKGSCGVRKVDGKFVI
mmetsp:Transcript_6181/g.16480  ORF Transcript_6181/g.16480 Transcript_6181/m.16480 type:complete len:89 (-) Transcript_6181:204-470(-)|eukprot:CAMPEP_0185831848 /NCGR_PEP_ID=MMETSP1353-20130828/1738_1 /TAXON_ID=1077150 /ORGANISM="Erythrolobus australicus, Strain CCMP3124" /LENGTH=88 /DNA_ID=CAMNT_0028529959 /DNA_START=198 /DNA_END=464 /DNA_ORIENTATION=+